MIAKLDGQYELGGHVLGPTPKAGELKVALQGLKGDVADWERMSQEAARVGGVIDPTSALAPPEFNFGRFGQNSGVAAAYRAVMGHYSHLAESAGQNFKGTSVSLAQVVKAYQDTESRNSATIRGVWRLK